MKIIYPKTQNNDTFSPQNWQELKMNKKPLFWSMVNKNAHI